MSNLIIEKNKIIMPDKITISHISNIYNEFLKNLSQLNTKKIIIDFNKTNQLDSAGVALIDQIIEILNNKNIQYKTENIAPSVKNIIDTFSSQKLKAIKPEYETKSDIITKIYNIYENFKSNIIFFTIILIDMIYWSFFAIIGKGQHKKDSITQQLILIGYNAVPIIGLMSLLVGLILALQSAAQLRQFGANIYIVDLIGIAMVREMGPLMTAIMMAGRSGSAFASEIATMIVTDEIDALKVMSINPIRFVLVPKFLAITIAMPLLITVSDFLGILGGFFIGILYLNIPTTAFLNRLVEILILSDITIGIFKGICFSWIIVTVGSYFGLKVKGGAQGVGKVTTASVVTSIFLVILADSIFSLIFYFG